MHYLRLIVLTIFFATTVHAEKRPLTDQERQCLLASPILTGASITKPLAGITPGYNFLIALMADIQGKGILRLNIGPSPVDLLLNTYGAKVQRKDYTNLAIARTTSYLDFGSRQLKNLIEGKELRPKFEAATVIFGLDLFYWDAMAGNCKPEDRIHEWIPELINQSNYHGIYTILATLPEEDPKQVLINTEGFILFSNPIYEIPMWYPLHLNCVRMFNAELKKHCRIEKKCYLIDIDADVQTLNSGGTLRLRNGRSYRRYAMRPDGVHLSNLGSIYIMEKMMDALEENPPTYCKIR